MIYDFILELCKEGIDNGWRKFGFFGRFSTDASDITDNICKEDGNKITDEEFITRYESTYTPCLVTNLMNHWPANENWTIRVANHNH